MYCLYSIHAMTSYSEFDRTMYLVGSLKATKSFLMTSLHLLFGPQHGRGVNQSKTYRHTIIRHSSKVTQPLQSTLLYMYMYLC